MAGDTKPIDRFTGTFLEELGRWSARVVIAAIIAIASGFIVLPN